MKNNDTKNYDFIMKHNDVIMKNNAFIMKIMIL